jgi:RNA polymerase sigma-70 factor (ECF subfamily)
MSEVEAPEPVTAETLAALVASHREFLAFVQRRVGDRGLAEEILQDALVRSLAHVEEIRESAIGWFYRVLRNAVIDHMRRHAVQGRRLEAFAAEPDTQPTDAELHAVVCQCVSKLAATLKPEYADALQRIDVDGTAVKDYAEDAGITASNAGVRVFRAREALRKQVARACGTCADHGCLDCTCGQS